MSMKRSWPDSLPSPPPTAIYSPPFQYNSHVYNSPQCYYDHQYYRHNHSLPSRDSAMASAGFQYESHVDLSRPTNGVHAVNTSITPDFNVPFDDHNNANGLYPVENNHNVNPCTKEPLLTQWILDDFYKMETTQQVASSCFPSPINTPSPVLHNDTSQVPISKKSQTRKKRQQRSGSMDIHCTNCNTSNTPLWRRNGLKQPLCNACGLFLKLHGIIRPLALKTDVIKKRNRKSTEPNDKHPKKQKQTPSLFWS